MTEPEDDQRTGRQNGVQLDDDLGLIERTMRALELTQGVEIARRYLAMNAFDGALTMLGLVLGGLITIDPANPDIIFNALLLAAVGTSIAMAVSGFSGSYLAESAERDREVEEIGKAMLTDMSDSMYAKASRTTSVVVAIVDGLSPAVAALIVITPLLLVPVGIIDVYTAFFSAIIVCMLLLFLLGLFLGRVSRRSMWSYGAKTLFAGIMTAILMFVISLLTGAGA
ncbi:MAG: VIT1/CCC1 transporter family protein [Candidatus Hodarchaeota archaeon]